MVVKAYVQGQNGEEWECDVSQPEPTEAKLDKCITIPRAAINAMHKALNTKYWVRVVSTR